MIRVAIIDCGSGNLRSVAKAFEKAAHGKGDVRVTARAEELAQATHIVLPGVGAFADCMKGLNALGSMAATMRQEAFEKQKPFLGICVGMQMLLEKGLEFGEHAGLGWFKGTVEPIKPLDSSYKIPHMGWNELHFPAHAHPVLEGVAPDEHVYFVHSYRAVMADRNDVLAETDYGERLPALIGRGNILGMQFHPEKSQAAGLALIANFLRMASPL